MASMTSRIRDLVAIGRKGSLAHHDVMMRIRAFAALLSCLAILAGSFMTVAAASVPSSPVMGELSAENPPCSHCDQCDAVPCPMPTAACLQASSTTAATLAATALELPTIDYDKIQWSPHATSLRGRSLSPDPFPPRR